MKDSILPKLKFPIILGFSALLIALCAGCFSVYGISTLFAGASFSVMIMASSLEIGKLVGTTFLYRYWKECGILKIYLTMAIIILMIITSLGIFGYLSAAYQKSSIEFGVTQQQINNLKEQKLFYQSEITDSKSTINHLAVLRMSQEDRMTEVVTTEFLTRSPVQLKQLQQQNMDMVSATEDNIKQENIKIGNDTDNINKINDNINNLQLGTAGKKDIQTFRFVADALHLSLDTVARWFIISIIFVFDPLAVCLILAYNVVVLKNKKDIGELKSTDIKEIDTKVEPIEVIPTKIPDVPSDIIQKPEPKKEHHPSGPSDFIRQMLKL